MEKSKDLIKTIEDQKIQLNRYERRFRDVVAAYKSLTKEKEALESSLKVFLSQKSEMGKCSSDQAESMKVQTKLSSAPEMDAGVYQEQLITLTKAIKTLTEGKTKMEVGYLADKKQLKTEKEDLEKNFVVKEQSWKNSKSSLEKQIEELRNSVRSQQIERTKEQNDHALMMRELQNLVATERSAKEDLEVQLEEVKLKNLDLTRPDKAEDKAKICDLNTEIENLKQKLKKYEETLKPNPSLLSLKRELAEMKTQHYMAVMKEQKRANDAEQLLQQTAQLSEERVVNLESRLSELSDMVGNYDRLRRQDQEAIQKLKERIMQLDIEKTVLSEEARSFCSTKTLPQSNNQPTDKADDSGIDVQALMDKILHIKNILKILYDCSDRPVDLNAFFKQAEIEFINDNAVYQDEFVHFKEEFEKFKLKEHCNLKTKNIKDNLNLKDIETLQAQIVELREKNKCLILEKDNKEITYKNDLEELRLTLSHERIKHASELASAESDYIARIGNIEQEMQKQRARTLALVDDKENEIRMLKLSLGVTAVSPTFKSTHYNSFEERSYFSKDSDNEEEQTETDIQKSEKLAEELSHSIVLGSKETRLLHYNEEIARRDVEISNLRKAKHELDLKIRNLKVDMQNNQDSYKEEVEKLKSHIQRLQRNFSREGENLEYLKNVVLSYMLSSDTVGRQHILNAIAAILKFSHQEVETVKRYNNSWWWQGETRKQN